MSMSIGVVVDDLRLGIKDGVRRAAGMGFRAVELGVTAAEVLPENLSATGRRHLGRFVRDFGLDFQALMGDVGGGRFGDASRLEENLDRTRRILELAADLRVPMVTGQIGGFDADTPAEQRDRVVEALRHIADCADRTGTIYAVESVGGQPEALRALLEGIDCSFIKASVDPAELIWSGMNPIEAVETLADDVVLARARDGVAGTRERRGRETSLGQGQVDLHGYLRALEGAGYGGPAMVRRVDTDRPVEEIAAAKALLESLRTG